MFRYTSLNNRVENEIGQLYANNGRIDKALV